MRRRGAASLALAAFVVSCGAQSGHDAAEGAPQASERAAVRASVVVAEQRPLAFLVRAIGTVVPRPGSFAELGAPAPTRVARVYVAPGQSVAKGAPLVGFEQAPFEAAARSAEAELENARRAHERALRLSGAGVLPQKDVDQTAADLARATADMIAARRAMELSTLRAPIAGIVTRMSAVLGAPVDVNQPVVAIVDPDSLDVVLSLAPAEAARIAPGAAVEMSTAQQAAAESLGTGTVTTVAAAVDSTSRSVEVRVHLSGPRRTLRVGENVFGRIAAAVHPDAVVVPAEALVPHGDGFQVYVVDARGIAHARPVATGLRTETTVELLRGVHAGERVVASGAYGLEEGARVVEAGR